MTTGRIATKYESLHVAFIACAIATVFTGCTAIDGNFAENFAQGFNQGVNGYNNQYAQPSGQSQPMNYGSQGYTSPVFTTGGTTGTVMQRNNSGGYSVKAKVVCNACGGSGFVQTAGITTNCGRCGGKGYIGN